MFNRLHSYLAGRDLLSENGPEARTLQRGIVPQALLPMTRTSLPGISEQTALRIADIFAAVKVLADGLSSLPLDVYRQTPRGRVPAGEDQRLVQLLRRPAPGTTSADLVSQIVVDLCVNGNAFASSAARARSFSSAAYRRTRWSSSSERGGSSTGSVAARA